MINEEKYPIFTYFMQAYMSDFSDFFEQAHEFKKDESRQKTENLEREIMRLKQFETSETQAFMLRYFNVKIKQKDIQLFFDTIINELKS